MARILRYFGLTGTERPPLVVIMLAALLGGTAGLLARYVAHVGSIVALIVAIVVCAVVLSIGADRNRSTDTGSRG